MKRFGLSLSKYSYTQIVTGEKKRFMEIFCLARPLKFGYNKRQTIFNGVNICWSQYLGVIGKKMLWNYEIMLK